MDQVLGSSALSVKDTSDNSSVSSLYQKQQSVVHKGIFSTQFSYLRGVLQYIKIVV